MDRSKELNKYIFELAIQLWKEGILFFKEKKIIG
jgi:hypothetical protein